MSSAAPRRRAWLVLVALGIAAGTAAGQVPGSIPPSPAPRTPPDTLVVVLTPFAGDPALHELRVEPADVTFGGVITLVARGPGSLAPADSLALPPWLELAPTDAQPPLAADDATLPLRVYGVNPFRIAIGDLTTGVVTVAGRGADGTRTAPVRDPLTPGWNLVFAAGLLLVLVLAALVARWLWQRRRGPRPRPADRPARGVAWPRAAVALDAVLERRRRDGDARAFLDGLATVARVYAADRFGIAGREMTGDEIAAACRELGHPAEVGGAFAGLLGALDARRYDPSPLDDAWCRARAADLVATIAAVRVMPGPTPLPEGELEAGRAAWDRLVAELQPAGEGRS